MTDAPLSLRKLASAAHESVVGDELTGVGIDGRLKAPEQLASRPETPAWPCAWRVRGSHRSGLADVLGLGADLLLARTAPRGGIRGAGVRGHDHSRNPRVPAAQFMIAVDPHKVCTPQAGPPRAEWHILVRAKEVILLLSRRLS